MELTKMAVYMALVIVLLADVMVARPHGRGASTDISSDLLALIKDSKYLPAFSLITKFNVFWYCFHGRASNNSPNKLIKKH